MKQGSDEGTTQLANAVAQLMDPEELAIHAAAVLAVRMRNGESLPWARQPSSAEDRDLVQSGFAITSYALAVGASTVRVTIFDTSGVTDPRMVDVARKAPRVTVTVEREGEVIGEVNSHNRSPATTVLAREIEKGAPLRESQRQRQFLGELAG